MKNRLLIKIWQLGILLLIAAATLIFLTSHLPSHVLSHAELEGRGLFYLNRRNDEKAVPLDIVQDLEQEAQGLQQEAVRSRGNTARFQSVHDDIERGEMKTKRDIELLAEAGVFEESGDRSAGFKTDRLGFSSRQRRPSIRFPIRQV